MSPVCSPARFGAILRMLIIWKYARQADARDLDNCRPEGKTFACGVASGAKCKKR